jgi:glycerol-3-phosphate O-acyltransferase
VGIRLARWLSRSLYRMRMADSDLRSLAEIDPEAAVVFVMNHRSNMDYVLVTWLVSQNGALAYAVGEWARVWPLSAVIRAMGAYFIRRRARSPLYRRVLARYVQMAVAGGLTQAMFPEGRLSLDGRLGAPRLGLLSYIVEGALGAGGRPGDPAGGRDVIFVPVALNYDRVLEDRFLVDAGRTGVRRFRPPLGTVLRGVGGHLWARATGRFRGFGTAKVALGAPLSLRASLAGAPGEPTAALAAELMRRVGRAVPVLPVPLVARQLLLAAAATPAALPATEAALRAGVEADLAALAARGVALPERGPEAVVADALALLRERGLLDPRSEGLRPRAEALDLLRFYAASIAHHFEASGPGPGAAG